MADTVVYETGGSGDKLLVESLPGERTPLFRAHPRVAGGFVAQDGWDARRGQGTAVGSELPSVRGKRWALPVSGGEGRDGFWVSTGTISPLGELHLHQLCSVAVPRSQPASWSLASPAAALRARPAGLLQRLPWEPSYVPRSVLCPTSWKAVQGSQRLLPAWAPQLLNACGVAPAGAPFGHPRPSSRASKGVGMALGRGRQRLGPRGQLRRLRAVRRAEAEEEKWSSWQGWNWGTSGI